MSNDGVKTYMLGKSPVSVGRFTYGVENLSVRQWGEGAGLQIGSFCSLADNIKIFLGGNHRTDWITTFPFGHVFVDELGGQGISGHPATRGDVIIGHDVWIGSGATLLSGVKIGNGAVVSADACVVKDVMPYHVVGGNPAQVIAARFEPEIIEILLELKWWDLPLAAIREMASILCSRPNKDRLLELLAICRP
jgi:acetyltransferase-like isoleucine patch superfamily enzyme